MSGDALHGRAYGWQSAGQMFAPTFMRHMHDYGTRPEQVAAVKAIHDTLRALRDGTPPGKLTGIADAELMKRVTRDADYTRWTKDFLV